MKKRALVIIPTYNEAENIVTLTEVVLNLSPDFDILVVDDNSSDGTGQLADSLSDRYQGRVFVLHRPGKLGLGTAHRDGFRWGKEHGYPRLVTMDADFSHPPQAIPLLLEKLQTAGLAIGSRYVPGGRIEGWTFLRKLNSWTANFLARCLMGLKARDCTGAFRAYQTSALELVPLEKLRAGGYSAHLEVLYYLERSGLGVVEVPITFVNRQQGRSKISPAEVRETLRIIFYYFFYRPRVVRPASAGQNQLEP